jgi:cytidine deaminase
MMTDQEIEELVAEATAVRTAAYVPYSGYAVGAALRTADGHIFSGCNVENASYGLAV